MEGKTRDPQHIALTACLKIHADAHSHRSDKQPRVIGAMTQAVSTTFGLGECFQGAADFKFALATQAPARAICLGQR